jgi:hypothetical protein
MKHGQKNFKQKQTEKNADSPFPLLSPVSSSVLLFICVHPCPSVANDLFGREDYFVAAGHYVRVAVQRNAPSPRFSANAAVHHVFVPFLLTTGRAIRGCPFFVIDSVV